MDSEYDKPQAARRHRPHGFSRILHILALLLLAMSFFCFLLVCISGVWTYEDGGKLHLAIANVSMVEFDGIIPKNNTTDQFDVKMRWFMSAFGWEYMASAKKELQAGIVFTGFARELVLPDNLRDVAKRLNVPESDYGCLSPNTGNCSPFFSKLKDVKELRYPSVWPWVIMILLFVTLLLVFVKDLLISFKKDWMRCHCCFLSSLCPNPKGSREENMLLPPSFWDGLRIYWFLSGALAASADALVLTLRARSVADSLRNRKMPNARASGIFIAMVWLGAALMWIALILMCISKSCNKGRERQNAALDEPHHPSGDVAFGAPPPVPMPHQEPYPAYMPPEPALASQHIPQVGGFQHDGPTPPTYTGKPIEDPYFKI